MLQVHSVVALFMNVSDPQNSLTGYGKLCTDLSNCIQGSDVMRCDKLSDAETNKVCLCTETSYNRGATCKRSIFLSFFILI